MNLVIVLGEIVSDVIFKFVYDKYEKLDELGGFYSCFESLEKYKHISIACCNLKLNNESIVSIYGYDSIADYMLRKLKLGDSVILEGRVNTNGRIEIKELIC